MPPPPLSSLSGDNQRAAEKEKAQLQEKLAETQASGM